MILTLKTADLTTTFTLLDDAQAHHQIAILHWDSGRTLADSFLSRLTTLLEEHHAALESLTGIIIFSGPGSFTSLRIGHTIANALADSLHLPITGQTGAGWIQAGLKALPQTPPGQGVFPSYGAEANVTFPKL